MSTSEIIEEINCKRNMSTSARDTFEESFENAREAEFAREFMDKFTEGDTSAKRKNRSNDKASVPLRLWNPQPVQPQSESRQDHTEDRGWSFGKFGEAPSRVLPIQSAKPKIAMRRSESRPKTSCTTILAPMQMLPTSMPTPLSIRR